MLLMSLIFVPKCCSAMSITRRRLAESNKTISPLAGSTSRDRSRQIVPKKGEGLGTKLHHFLLALSYRAAKSFALESCTSGLAIGSSTGIRSEKFEDLTKAGVSYANCFQIAGRP